MLISGHIFIMPQRRFKFKLCRLARGERSLDSLPIIQLLLPSPPSLLLSPSLVHSVRSICCLLPEKFSRQGESSTSLFLSVLFAPAKVPEKKFHTFSFINIYVRVILFFISSIFLCFAFTD